MTDFLVIFLDIDGVLLPFPDPKVPENCLFPDETCQALEFLHGLRWSEGITGKKIVLSSTWRVIPEQIDLIYKEFQRFDGLKDVKFADMTDPNLHCERQHEIQAYLDIHKPKYWIAIDDEDLLEGPQNAKNRSNFEGHVVHCDSKVGLTRQLVLSAAFGINRQVLQERRKRGHPPTAPTGVSTIGFKKK